MITSLLNLIGEPLLIGSIILGAVALGVAIEHFTSKRR